MSIIHHAHDDPAGVSIAEAVHRLDRWASTAELPRFAIGTLQTTTATVEDILANRVRTPLPLEVIPNHMGINLVSVAAIEWQRQLPDGQLRHVTIYFTPSKD